MASYNKFQAFAADVCNKVHNLGSDALTIALTAQANIPISTNSVLTNLTQIAYTNLVSSPANRVPTNSGCTQSGGTAKLVLQDITLSCTAATVAAFSKIVLYNDTAASDQLISWWDYGATDVTLAATETFTIDFDTSGGVLTLA